MTSTPTPTETPVPAVIDCPIFSGPAKSERFGTILTIDLGSQDMALAVSRDNRMPRASVVVTTAARNIIRLSKAGEKVEGIVVHGSEHDATMHPEFGEIVGNLRDLRNKWYPKAKLWLVSQDPHLEEPPVQRALSIFDRVCVRMEWGTAKSFVALTQRKSSDYALVMGRLAGLEHLVIYARFMRGEIDNSTDVEVRAWVKRIGELKPREVYLLTAETKVAGKKVRVAPKSRLSEISEEVKSKTGIQPVLHAGERIFG